MHTPDLSKIVETEDALNALLPLRRMEQSPPADLIAAAIWWSQMVWAEAELQGDMPLTDEQISWGFNLAQRPVFVCGVHRSGTTLVRNLLDGHPDLAVLPSEGTYYTNLENKLRQLPVAGWAAFFGMEWLRRIANPINQPPYWLLGRTTADRSPYVDFARYLLAWWQVLPHTENTQWPHTAIVLAYASCFNSKAALWVDKTPANERFLARIWQEMPIAKIVLPVRDPVAVLASRKKMEPGLNLRRALLDLRLSFRTAVEQTDLNDPRFQVVRYEELTANTDVTIQKLVDFLGIEFSDVLNTPTVAGIPAGANSSFKQDPEPGQILKSNKNKDSAGLTKTELQLLSVCLGGFAEKLNYPLPKVGFLRTVYLTVRYRLW